MWEHPKLSESIRKVFHQETKPIFSKRSLNDSLLQGANREAYMRHLGKQHLTTFEPSRQDTASTARADLSTERARYA